MKDKLKNSKRFIISSRVSSMACFIVLLLVIASCESPIKESHEEHTHSMEETYYCPMDTEIVSTKPGICPKCDMDLVKKDDSKTILYYCPMDTEVVRMEPGVCPICGMDLVVKPQSESTDSYNLISNPSNAIVLSSVMAVKPEVKSVPITIKIVGSISYDTRRIYTISSRVDEGRVEKLYVKFPFQPVKKGQPLLELFSHELLSAQKEYFFIKETDPEATDLVNAAKQKLLLLGMTEAQINNFKNDGHVHPTTTIYSPYTGYVVENIPEEAKVASSNKGAGMGSAPMKNKSYMSANQQEQLILREGTYLGKGAIIFKVVNTDIVWGIFEIYSDQLPLLRLDQIVNIKVENSEEMITGKVDFIEPNYQDGSKTSRFRVYLSNKNQKLKIGNLLQGEIKTEPKQGLWAPESAVYDLGVDKIVFVKKGDAFETRKVVTGINSANLVQILSGLNENDEIAANAQYMVDSESFIKAKNE